MHILFFCHLILCIDTLAHICVHSSLYLCFQPFSIVHYGAVCGVVVTASHNPKQDNGYKVRGA